MTTSHPREERGEAGDGLERVRHLKTGGEYEVLGEAEGQVSSGNYRVWPKGADPSTDAEELAARTAHDGSAITVYRSRETGKLWWRFTDEFRDGRFETIATASQAAPVAWMFEYRVPNGEGAWEHRVEFDEPREGHWLRNVRPLFETPQPAGAERVDLGELERLSAAATPGAWYTVDTPWGDGTWVVAGNPDPHAGAMVCDCQDINESRPEDGPDAADDAAFIAALVTAYRSGHLVPASLPAALGSGEGTAASDVLAERRRQVEAEGYTTAHDDEHAKGEIARAAACYARIASDWDNYAFPIGCPADWPWSPVFWKWSDPRRDLVKAGALILAEIERLDRAAPCDEPPKGEDAPSAAEGRSPASAVGEAEAPHLQSPSLSEVEEAREAFERHYRRGFTLTRADWGDGYLHDGIDAMWKGWSACWRERGGRP